MILAIYGSGGLGREIFDIADNINIEENRWDQIVYIDDSKETGLNNYNQMIYNYNDFKSKFKCNDCQIVIGIGEPKNRNLLYDKVKNDGYSFANIIAKNTVLSKHIKLGIGNIICEGVTIHTGVVIGDNCLIQPQAVLGHDIKIGNHTVLSAFCAPGGASEFGDRVYVGMHATIRELLKIGNDAIIGMGAVVARDVEANTTVVGNPARPTIGNASHKVFNH